MAMRMRKTISLGKGARLNVSKSGISASTKTGPVTMNSRGRTSVHVAPGMTYQTPTAAAGYQQADVPARDVNRGAYKVAGVLLVVLAALMLVLCLVWPWLLIAVALVVVLAVFQFRKAKQLGDKGGGVVGGGVDYS